MKKILLIIALFISALSIGLLTKSAYAGCIPPSCGVCACPSLISGCQTHCLCVSGKEKGTSDDDKTTMGHITNEFKKHRGWMVDLFFNDEKPNDPPGLRAAMKLMTSQLVTIGVQQVQIIGTFFDAKHQLETQRLFQRLTAQAHKDYQPSEGLCEVGTVIRSLGATSRNADLAAVVLSKRSTDRQALTKETVGGDRGIISDQQSRLVEFITKYCDKKDNANNLDYLCAKGGSDSNLFNKDISYTTTIDAPLTIDIDFTQEGASRAEAEKEEEKAVFALMAHLFSHSLFPFVSDTTFVNSDGKPNFAAAAETYLDARALMAKRSVASNTIASIAALKAKGDKESQPFIYALMKEMGGDDIGVEDIKKYIGERPSYYAQMEVLTKKLYQSPNFYTELYDKPANVMRKDVAIQAASLMQKRDLYRSYLRSEMILSVMLESAIIEEQQRVTNEIGRAKGNLLGRKIGN